MKVTAHAERHDRWWIVTIPEVEGGIHTQARRLDQVAEMAADAVATATGVDVDAGRGRRGSRASRAGRRGGR